MKLRAPYLLPLALLLISCDPPHYVNFINTTNKNARIKINLESNTLEPAFTELANGDSIVLNLKPKDTANLNFGIVTWSDEQIKEVVKDFKSMEIETSEIRTIYKTQESMQNLMSENKKGMIGGWETEIRIKIK